MTIALPTRRTQMGTYIGDSVTLLAGFAQSDRMFKASDDRVYELLDVIFTCKAAVTGNGANVVITVDSPTATYVTLTLAPSLAADNSVYSLRNGDSEVTTNATYYPVPGDRKPLLTSPDDLYYTNAAGETGSSGEIEVTLVVRVQDSGVGY